MDLIGLLLLLAGTVVAWCVVAYLAYVYGLGLACRNEEPSTREELTYYALLATLVILLIAGLVIAVNIISPLTGLSVVDVGLVIAAALIWWRL